MIRLLCACAFLSLACDKGQEKAPDPAKPAEPAEPSAPAASPKPAEPPVGTASMPRGLVGGGQMQHCPTAVPGAMTSIAATAEAVELTITGKDEKATADIRSDARHLKEVAQKFDSAVKHTGEGEGGGGLGKCPVVLKDTQISVVDVEGGAKITLKPAKPEGLEWLKQEVEARHAKAKAP